MRILNVADFNWMTGAERHSARLSLFDICRKFTLAGTRANHLVVEFSDRAVARMGSPLRLRGLGRGWANRRFLQCVDELRPDLILLHFADQISNKSLQEARRISPGVLIAEINIDPIDTPKNQRRLSQRNGFVDALFVSTAEPDLGRYVSASGFAAFLPNPVDPSIETGRTFENEAPAYDLLFPAHDDRPREIGVGNLQPSVAVERLKQAVPSIRLNNPGIAGAPEAGGYRYFDALQSARIGWCLSRRATLPLYASDRMAHMFGWGQAVLIDRRSGFDRLYGANEAAFYDGWDDLLEQLRWMLADDQAARAMAASGWKRTWTLFESGRVLSYVLEQLGRDGGAGGYEWPCDRWHA